MAELGSTHQRYSALTPEQKQAPDTAVVACVDDMTEQHTRLTSCLDPEAPGVEQPASWEAFVASCEAVLAPIQQSMVEGVTFGLNTAIAKLKNLHWRA